jgi:hypothetical protein
MHHSVVPWYKRRPASQRGKESRRIPLLLLKKSCFLRCELEGRKNLVSRTSERLEVKVRYYGDHESNTEFQATAWIRMNWANGLLKKFPPKKVWTYVLWVPIATRLASNLNRRLKYFNFR